MKALVLIVAVLAAFATPASAQRRGGDENSPHANPPEKPKPDEKAYKAALERIPDPKVKYDPWGGVSSTPAAAPAPGKKK